MNQISLQYVICMCYQIVFFYLGKANYILQLYSLPILLDASLRIALKYFWHNLNLRNRQNVFTQTNIKASIAFCSLFTTTESYNGTVS